jgi:hypothetical protein
VVSFTQQERAANTARYAVIPPGKRDIDQLGSSDRHRESPGCLAVLYAMPVDPSRSISLPVAKNQRRNRLSRPLSTEKLCSADLSSRYTRKSRRRNACLSTYACLSTLSFNLSFNLECQPLVPCQTRRALHASLGGVDRPKVSPALRRPSTYRVGADQPEVQRPSAVARPCDERARVIARRGQRAGSRLQTLPLLTPHFLVGPCAYDMSACATDRAAIEPESGPSRIDANLAAVTGQLALLRCSDARDDFAA